MRKVAVFFAIVCSVVTMSWASTPAGSDTDPTVEKRNVDFDDDDYYKIVKNDLRIRLGGIDVELKEKAEKMAADEAAKIWPIIEEYRSEMAEFPVAMDSLDPIVWKGNEIFPKEYWDKRFEKVVRDVSVYRNLSRAQIRNTTSESSLVLLLKVDIEIGLECSPWNMMRMFDETIKWAEYWKSKLPQR